MSATYDFQVVNTLGTVVYTSAELDLAKRFVRANLDTFPGLRVECVTVTTRREVVYRPRSYLRAVA